MLDLDDVGPEVGQDHGSQGPGYQGGRIDDAYPLERQRSSDSRNPPQTSAATLPVGGTDFSRTGPSDGFHKLRRRRTRWSCVLQIAR